MSVLGWVLVGLAAWVVVAVVLALVVGHFVRPDRMTTLDLLRAQEMGDAPREPAEPPGSARPATDLPVPRDGGHDDAAATARRRRRAR
ncbi:hypothetical protein [Actinomycetospora cinnamomea]|uniref:hypothetical protein n=1 Tax=Actinomycetospora cinnamomea TaxID=663609 RepID=UPI00105810DA|nr:hypothetical protein [Actinomycetospora cinnamomea]